MSTSLFSLIELIAAFSIFIGFCVWQLHGLKKLDKEDAEKKIKDESHNN